MIVFLFFMLVYAGILIGVGVLLGYLFPVLQAKHAYKWIIGVYLILYMAVVVFEIQIGLMIPFILAVAVFINFSRYLSGQIKMDMPIRSIAVLLVFGGTFLAMTYMLLFGRNYNYPSEDKYKNMAEEGYANLTVQHPMQKLLTTHYHSKIYKVEDHCPIADDGKNPNRDYIIATYQEAFGLTHTVVYHNCGYGKFWGGPDSKWELSKDKIVAESK